MSQFDLIQGKSIPVREPFYVELQSIVCGKLAWFFKIAILAN